MPSSCRFGLIGASRIAPLALIAPAAGRNDAEIVAVASRRKASAEAFAARFGLEAVEGYEALWRRTDIDAVYIALPPAFHRDAVIGALQAGKHVLCEKPMALSAADAEAIVACAEENGRVLIEALHSRYHPLFLEAERLVSERKTGPLTRLEAGLTGAVAPSADEYRYDVAIGGGALADLGCYGIHWLRTLAGGDPTLTAVTKTMRDGVDIEVHAELCFAGGQSGHLSCRLNGTDGPRSWIEARGTEGTLRIENPLLPHEGHSLTLERDGHRKTYTVGGQTSWFHQLDHALAAFRGAVSPLTGGRDSIRNAAVLEALRTADGRS